jgi:subtilisin family serine protease
MYEQSFLGEEPVVVPGEAVVVVAGEVAQSLEVSVPTMPTRGAVSGVTALGVGAIDDVLGEIGAYDIARLHGPTPPPALGLMASTTDAVLSATFRVRFDESRPVDDLVDRLAEAEGVELAEAVLMREVLVTPNDTMFGSQWGLSRIRCPEAWDLTTGDPGVIVAVIDTGVDLDHPDLAGLVLPGYDTVDRGLNPPSFLVQGQTWVWEGDFAGKDNIPQDEVGHGTHVAGTISAASNNGSGVAGVTWRCPILPVKVLNRARRVSDNRISGFGMSDEIAEGIRWAADHGARVINMSLGSSASTVHEANAVAYAISRGCVVVAAMGNDNTATPSYPAAYPNVLAVAATDSSDKRASFSNFGPHVGVSAPGVGVQSTYWDNTYASANGTSMASPHVAGVAALVLSCKPSLSEAQVRQIIRETARPLQDAPGDPVPNDRYGSGLVDARAALDRACPPRRLTSIRIVDCDSKPIFRCLEPVESRQIICLPSVAVPCPSRRLILCETSPVSCFQSNQICPSVGGPRCPNSLRCDDRFDPPIGRFGDLDPSDDPYGVDYDPDQW